jgi:hypothetical protein
MLHFHRHQSQTIRCFANDAAAAGPLAQHDAGIQTIAVAAIVGSVCRGQSLRSDFQPIHCQGIDSRYCSVITAMRHGASLPAIEVYRLGNHFYVLDGHHRVAAARALGQLSIEAIVIECQPISCMTMSVAA